MAGEYVPQTDNQQQIFDVFEEMRKLPDTSGSMLTDVCFSDVPEASSRIFRIYRFARRQVHGFPAITTQPFVVLSVDVPRRRPDDIVFVNPEDGDAKQFMARNNR